MATAMKIISPLMRNAIAFSSKVCILAKQTHFKINIVANPLRVVTCAFHTSTSQRGLMEFFEEKNMWGEDKIKCGRPWRIDELRLKSSEDLHKLWYVLLKERNMLMTMEHEYVRECELFPSPERMEKVEHSMENLLEVIKERDEAYNMLEHPQTKPEGRVVRNALGIKYFRKCREQAVPMHVNKTYRLLHPPYEKWKGKYLSLYYEKRRLEKRKAAKRELRNRRKLQEKYPHLTEDDLDAAFDNKIQ
ncbi:hypothetical protein ScPMuIL_007456 [Solemya velum]